MGSVFMTMETPMKPSINEPIGHHSPAAVVFSYDFEDGNLSDWFFFSIDDGAPYTVYPGNVTVVDGEMVMGADHYNIAMVNSSVAYGTWSFDIFVVDQPIDHEIVIPFILIEYNTDAYMMQSYFLQIITGHYGQFFYPYTEPDELRVQAGKAFRYVSSHFGRSIEWLAQFNTEDIWGWKNFIVTREDDGQFYVYMNRTLVLGFKDTQHTTCNYFCLSTRLANIDNIVVSDSVDYDAAPPEWEPVPTNQFIALGEDFSYDINASDFSGVDTATWAVNDTTNFAIDSDGVITNVVGLARGTYGLNVSVSDTGGFTRSATFNVMVESSVPGALPYIIVGGGAFLIVLVIVLIRSRR
jgi:hypothetical protein